ncbi:MAG: hypothetical protein IJA97_03075 [Clostridia bacterium]|nr:hypothetical protein [Clostridia bacterium]
MKRDIKAKLKGFLTRLQASSFKKGKAWKGFSVYEPVYKVEKEVGFPRVVLEAGGELRLSSYEECFEYMRFVKYKESANV